MEIDAFLADSVQASGGKLHALGIGWRAIVVGGLPARHDRWGSASWSGPRRPRRVRTGWSCPCSTPAALRGRSAPTGPRSEAKFQTPPGDGTATLALNLDGLVFEAVGAYAFVLGVDGNEMLPAVVPRPDPAGAAGP